MSLRVCPIASVHAPAEEAWRFLSQPANFALWWDARTESITPEGCARPGQRIHAVIRALGLRWNVDVLVEDIDEARHALDVMTSLPLGIIIFHHVTCIGLDPKTCQISLGCEFSISPAWWGWLLEHYASQQLYRSIATALSRVKQAVETDRE
jgi:hypothetical protein